MIISPKLNALKYIIEAFPTGFPFETPIGMFERFFNNSKNLNKFNFSDQKNLVCLRTHIRNIKYILACFQANVKEKENINVKTKASNSDICKCVVWFDF